MRFVIGKMLFDSWFAEIKSTEPPLIWSSCDPIFEHIEVAPERIILVAGPPGAGKTALFGQRTTGILTRNPELRILQVNVEMSPHALLSRQLSRLSNVRLTAIRRRQVDPADVARLDAAGKVIASMMDRLAFASEPHRLDQIAKAGSDHRADLICVDDVQRAPIFAEAELVYFALSFFRQTIGFSRFFQPLTCDK